METLDTLRQQFNDKCRARFNNASKFVRWRIKQGFKSLSDGWTEGEYRLGIELLADLPLL